MLVDKLRAIRTSADVGSLFSELGYQADNLPFAGGALTVARWRGFRVIATDKANALDGVRELARNLATSSEQALAAVVGPDRTLALAAPKFGQTGISRALLISLDEPSGFALQQLERLGPNRSPSTLAHSLAVADVLSSEEVGERFFASFKKNLERMAESIDRRRSGDDRRMVALICLSRILFLYFVQSKGWMDGRKDYLKYQLDTALAHRRNFHRSVLNPLFFETLNQPPTRRSKNSDLGSIPYLNGGLFETHPSERRIGSAVYDNELWREVFDGLFERFRFSIREANEVDAIAPDMLGRVFERLMNSDERHDSGTFYTPEAVVRQVVTATIATALRHDLPERVVTRLDAGESVSDADADAARAALERIRILDPAVGSGAFLLEALNVLARMRLLLEPDPEPTAGLSLRKRILRENLMGIDLNPFAVHLAELRLWLSVVADDPTTDIDEVSPLPNLDGVVRQGDTLLDPLGAARSFSPATPFFSRGGTESVRSARQALFEARGRSRNTSTRRLRRSELELAERLLSTALQSTVHATNDLTATENSKDLFGGPAGLSSKQRDRLRALEKIHAELERTRRKLREGQIPFFSFEVHAPDILAEGGFTVVVGNPPWVRAEQLPRRLRTALGERFQWWRASGRVGYAHLPDLSVAFLERCLELTRSGGAVGLLLPSKVTSAGYAETARRGVVRETAIQYVHRVSAREAASFGATTYPLAVVVKKQRARRDHRVGIGFGGKATLDQRSLDVPGPWILLPSGARDALEEFREAGTPLGEAAPPMLGVKTGADRLFLGRVVDGDESVSVVELRQGRFLIETCLLRVALRGRDVRRFAVHPKEVLIWCHGADGTPLTRIPQHAAQYFEQCAESLRRRSDHRAEPVWCVFRTRCTLGEHRLAWPDISRRPRAVALNETQAPTAIPMNTCYVSATTDRETALAAVAVMNSTWAASFFMAGTDEASGGYRRINARAARRLPVPLPGHAREKLAQLSKRVHQDEDLDNEELDDAVANTLGLSNRSRQALRLLAENSS